MKQMTITAAVNYTAQRARSARERVARCLDRFASPHLTLQTISSGHLVIHVVVTMATTENRDVPKERIFGPMVMDRGCLRAPEAWTREHQSLGLQALVPFPKLAPKTQRLCQMVPEGFYCNWKPHLPWVLQAPAVKVKQRPRRGGGRHACPLYLITLGPQHMCCVPPAALLPAT